LKEIVGHNGAEVSHKEEPKIQDWRRDVFGAIFQQGGLKYE